jgi:twitching motility protein PilT
MYNGRPGFPAAISLWMEASGMDDGMRGDPLGGSMGGGTTTAAPSGGGLAGFPTEPAKQTGGGEHTIVDLLGEMISRRASDLHLTVGSPPCIRVDGEINPLGYPRYLPQDVKGLVFSMMREDQIKQFEIEHEFDFAYGIKTLGRFRVNVFMQRGSVGCVIRAVPTTKKTMEELGLPPVTKDLIMRPRGIILVTGPTGSGKSTSLAAMIDYINDNRKAHIITVEDPIEFLHEHKSCLVNQRELGPDTQSFAVALKHVLRQDPDVILVGEMRDLETMATAITAAETGHLVFATLHTNDAAQTIDRIIDVFPPHQQAQIRLQIANSLQAIFCQCLCRRVGGGRVMAYELLIANNAIRNLIREGKIHQIPSAIEVGQQIGMKTLTMVLTDLVNKQVVTREEARTHASNPADFDKFFTI